MLGGLALPCHHDAARTDYAIAVFREGGFWKPGPSTAMPQDTIYSMLDAARAGDTMAYLAQYTGRMEADLRQAIVEKTQAGFSDYLRSSNAEIKGVAVSEPKPLSDTEVEVRVEYIYQERNEVQRAVLEKRGTSWSIGSPVVQRAI